MTTSNTLAATIETYKAQIGELLQHHITHDPNLLETSDWYYGHLKAVLHRNPAVIKRKPRRYLEIACYRHILGYRLAKDYEFESTQFDICDQDLEIGRQLALEAGFPDAVDRVVGDFHDLPFSDNHFDVAFISASIHHTRTPERIIGEAMRVLTDGGLFYCQREPCERLFSFYQFTANRAALYTPYERKIHERDMMRIISSPFPGARNAELFGRVENEHIPLDRYCETFAQYGTVLEEVTYYDGLLTRPDKEILTQADGLNETELSRYIYQYLMREIHTEIAPSFSDQDRHLGYSLPSEGAILAMANRTAHALKARPSDTKSKEYHRAMARIFGGSLRFVVRRDRKEKTPTNQKFRRSTTTSGNVKLDDAVYKWAGLTFWDRLLPDIKDADGKALHASAFPKKDWTFLNAGEHHRMMTANGSVAEIKPKLDRKALLVARYRVLVDKDMPFLRLRITQGKTELENVVVAQSEDRVFRLVFEPGDKPIRFTLSALDGSEVETKARLRIPILQAIPVSEPAMQE